MSGLERITENTYVKLGTVGVIVGLLLTLVVRDTTFRLETTHAIEGIAKDVAGNTATLKSLDAKVVGKSPSGWHRSTQERWASEASAALNEWWLRAEPDRSGSPRISLPDPWSSSFDPRPQ